MSEKNKQEIVLVDDDPKIRDLTAKYLRDQGLHVCTAEGGKALDKVLEQKKKYH